MKNKVEAKRNGKAFAINKFLERKQKENDEYIEERISKLVKWADDHKMRLDWHEPDEQGITAVVIGTSFDNAFGEDDRVGMSEPEIVIELKDDEGESVRINLATLLAAATYRDRSYREEV